MPYSGSGSFSVDTNRLEGVLKQVKGARDKASKDVLRRMKAATMIVYKTASARRPLITKAQMRKEGRRYQVSDPDATLGVPVRTGALQISIKQSVEQKGDKTTGTVYTKSPYAGFLEFGTSKMAARPFMRPALSLQIDAIKALFANKN